MRLINPKLLLGLISLAAVLWLFLWDRERTQAGPISAAHAQEVELTDPARCVECHGEGDVTLAEACVVCHAAIGQQLAAASGLHGALEAELRDDCGHCHLEHVGRDFQLVGEQSFELAGYEGRDGYDHSGLAYALDGAHAGLVCEKCHEHASDLVLAKGTARFLGLSQACESCHEDPHEGLMQRGCEECHDQVHPFKELTLFVHAESFPLEGAHLGPECVVCHPAGGAWSVEALSDPACTSTPRGCVECHESPHRTSFIEALAYLTPAGQEVCSLCHLATHDSFHGLERGFDREWHGPATGFELKPPHDAVSCAGCHRLEGVADDDLDAFALRYRGRAAEDCATCHDDPHNGQFAADSTHTLCTDCHLSSRFRPSAFDSAKHRETDFPLLGSHEAVACLSCHVDPAEAPAAERAWNNLASECVDCHEDVHAEAFSGASLPAEVDGRAGCARCHDTTTFTTLHSETFDHGFWTGFALDGAHVEADCERCHLPSEASLGDGRRLGRIEEIHPEGWSASQPCVQCHEDVHAGEFDAPHLPTEVEGRRGCARCHDTRDFANVPGETFDHTLWTEHALVGAHARAECTNCHLPREVPDERGRRFGRIEEIHGEPNPACVTCHADPHFAVFDSAHAPATLNGEAGCARCHTPHSFVELEFDAAAHDLWTGTTTATEHAQVDCDGCHPRLEPKGPRGRGRAAAMGLECVSCHSDPHVGQFLENGVTDCTRCHVGDRPFAESHFDHQRDSRFPLDETHAKLECAACHQAWPVPGSEPVIRYKPLGMECTDCHLGIPPAGGGPR